ncbi:NAD(P)/FAD-dependent oxidoreductase [Sinorhizobium meliloti]|uniref:NAD(P)/FAD-dependent oxidoreductase n=1 Tax=Rhizobium meliloti TaxID=382 RepID=UPI00037356C1|nr:FAD-dependent oxidoreductase [Sinorhizobium meliloti]
MLDAVIVGGGVAAHRAAMELSKSKEKIRITMISEEAALPYDRPALSKNHLQRRDESITLPGSEIYGQGVKRVNSRAVNIDPVSQRLSLTNGESLGYDKLLLATGSQLRRLPVEAPDGVLYLRTLEDAARLTHFLAPGVRVGIVGGGFIGLEVAAVAAQLGASPYIVEAGKALLERVGSTSLSRWAMRTHAGHSVNMFLNSRVERIESSAKGAYTLQIGDSELEVDCVVVGIGIVPETALARQASVVVNDGVMVDRSCLTSDQSIWAAGEVTRYPARFISRHIRSESWTSSGEQGAAAGRSMLGDDNAAFEDCPWLWSDQYGHSIQSLGLPSDASRRIMHGDPESDQWLELGFDEQDRFVGAIGMNVGRHISSLRRALRAEKAIPDQYPDLA